MNPVVVSGLTLGAFGLFAPPVIEARRADPDDIAMRQDMRIGQGIATAWSLAMTMVVVSKSGSKKPYLYWLLTVGAMMFIYEFLYRGGSTGCGCEERKNFLREHGAWPS